MARIVLLRHAHSVANEKNLLAGRTPGISLSKTGKEQAKDLIARLGATQFDEITISPLQRCRETIDPWLATTGAKTPAASGNLKSPTAFLATLALSTPPPSPSTAPQSN